MRRNEPKALHGGPAIFLCARKRWRSPAFRCIGASIVGERKYLALRSGQSATIPPEISQLIMWPIGVRHGYGDNVWTDPQGKVWTEAAQRGAKSAAWPGLGRCSHDSNRLRHWPLP